MYLAFLLLGWSKKEFDKISWSVYEIGLRMGYKFIITTNIQKSENVFIIEYRKNSFYENIDSDLKLNSENWQEPIGYNFFGLVLIDSYEIWAKKEYSPTGDMVQGVYQLLSLQHEKAPTVKFDNKNRIIPDTHPFFNNQLFQKPFIDNSALYLESKIKKLGFLGKKHFPFGNVNKPVVSLSHDVDGPYLNSAFSTFRSLFLTLVKRNKKEQKALIYNILSRIFKVPDPYFSFKDWMDFETIFDLKSAFYFYVNIRGMNRHINDPHYNLRNDNQLLKSLRELAKSGWEIGLHWGLNSGNLEDLSKSKLFLERIIENKIYGGRAHYWAINDKTPFSLFSQLHQAGFEYDASINPQINGLRNGTFMPITVSGFWDSFLENKFFSIPTSFMDAYFIKDYSPIPNTMESSFLLLDAILKNNGIALLDWHERVFCNYGVYKDFMESLVEILSSEDIEFYKMKPVEIIEKWKKYSNEIFLGKKNLV